MITGSSTAENQQPVSLQERAARYGQKPTAIALTGVAATETAYQLERKLFDNGHAATVLESAETALIEAIKNAGLIALVVTQSTDSVDLSFDTEQQSIDDIYSALKEQDIVH